MERFQPGGRPGPGRPKGSLSGRSKALSELDKMLSRPKNAKRLREAMQTAFDLDPLDFFRRFVLPLMPKKLLVENSSANPPNDTIMGVPTEHLSDDELRVIAGLRRRVTQVPRNGTSSNGSARY